MVAVKARSDGNAKDDAVAVLGGVVARKLSVIVIVRGVEALFA